MPLQHASRCWSCDLPMCNKKPAPLSLLQHFAAQYKFFVIIIIIINNVIILTSMSSQIIHCARRLPVAQLVKVSGS